jgi:predicted metal-dependent hydrolase
MLEIDGIAYPVTIERKNNKNIYIRIKEENVIYVTVPYLYSDKQVQKVLEENKKSISKMLQKNQLKHEKEEGIWYLGKQYFPIITPLYDLEFIGNKIYIKNEKILDAYIKSETKKIFLEHLNQWYHTFEEKIPYPTLKIRKMKTRWGVCNRKNNTVTLNSDLIKYELDKLDYVIIHELSHFRHFDHSKEFWKLVEKYEPNYKKIRKELR